MFMCFVFLKQTHFPKCHLNRVFFVLRFALAGCIVLLSCVRSPCCFFSRLVFWLIVFMFAFLCPFFPWGFSFSFIFVLCFAPILSFPMFGCVCVFFSLVSPARALFACPCISCLCTVVLAPLPGPASVLNSAWFGHTFAVPRAAMFRHWRIADNSHCCLFFAGRPHASAPQGGKKRHY